MDTKKAKPQKSDKKYLAAAAILAVVLVAVLAVFAITQHGGKSEVEQKPTGASETADLTCSRLASSLGTEVQIGKTTALTAFPEGGSAPYTYKFLVYNPSTDAWFILQDYTSGGTYYWTPGTAGNRTVYVDVKDSAGHQVRQQLDLTVM